MSNESAFTLFGQPTPEQVRQSIGRTAMSDGMAFGSLPLGRGPAAAMHQGGSLLGGAINSAMGNEDPEIIKAKQAEKAYKEIKSLDYNLDEDPGGFLTQSAQIFMKNDRPDLAFQSLLHAEKIKLDRGKLEADMAGAGGASTTLTKLLNELDIAEIKGQSNRVKALQAKIKKEITRQESSVEFIKRMYNVANARRKAEAAKSGKPYTPVQKWNDLPRDIQAQINLLQRVGGLQGLERDILGGLTVGDEASTTAPETDFSKMSTEELEAYINSQENQ